MSSSFPELKKMIDENEIAARVKALANKIDQDFSDADKIICIGVLKGSFIFLADLVRQISKSVKIEFVGVSSYEGSASTGHVRITHDLSFDIKGKDVLLVEDIVDTGITLDYLRKLLLVREPKRLKTCAFLSKPEAHLTQQSLDYVGFEISDEFVVGYGLDYNGNYRNVPYVAELSLNHLS